MSTQLAHSTNALIRLRRAGHLAPLALIAALAAAPLLAGPVAPPAGAVGPTMKTLAEVEPRTAINATNTPGDADSLYRITQPGSYYLTGNITGASGKRGIEIASNNVTIDLGGFTLTGVSGSLSGISVESVSFDRTVVRNGTVIAWPGGGVSVNNSSRLTGLTVYGNGIAGLRAGTNAYIESCTAKSNAGGGIEVSDDSIVRSCITSNNGNIGIFATSSCRVEQSVSSFNGDFGISIGNMSVASGCTADDNAGDGIVTSDQASVIDCSVSTNAGAGINAAFGVLVARCTAYVNTGAGIRAGSGCRVESNNCRFNGAGAGLQAGILIHANTSRTLVLNNTCTGNDYGIKVEGTLCLIKGNTVTSSTTSNFEIVANNRVATILTLPLSGAISGNVGGSTISDPDANYAY